MVDDELNPWLLEVNHLSSLGTDSQLDDSIKSELIGDTFKLLNLSVKRKIKTKKESADYFSKRMHRQSFCTQE